MKKIKMPGKCKFLNKWLEQPQYIPCLT
jgi:hypothetical protein